MYEQDYLALKDTFKNDINAFSRLNDGNASFHSGLNQQFFRAKI